MASSPDSDLKAWLASRTQDAGAWPMWSWVAGVGGTVAVVAQAFALSMFFQGWIFDHRSFADLTIWWVTFPGAVAVRALSGWAREEAGLRASRLVRQSLRADLVDQVGRLGPAWKAGQSAGSLTSKLVEQVDGPSP